MSFQSLPWLIALVPWAILVVYLFAGRSINVPVPFLDLWPAGETAPKLRRIFRPPLAVFAILSAIFLTIVASAHPQLIAATSGTNRPVTLIEDHGITMSARHWNAPDLREILGTAPITLHQVPGPGPTAMDTRDELTRQAKQALVNPDAIVVVESDQKLGISNPRLVQIVPPGSMENIGIADLSVRASPSPQAMVRLTNNSHEKTTTLTVTGATPLTVNLPPRGEQANFVVDLTSAARVVQAEISPGGDITADDRAWAVRGQDWPSVEARCPMFPEVDRILDVYRRNRPTDSHRITTVCRTNQLPLDEPVVGVLTPQDPTLSLASGPLQVEANPITDGVDFSATATDAQIAAPPANWHPVIRAGDQVLVATRDNPRQVWIGFRSAALAATPDFVIFWTKVLDWVGAGDDRYFSEHVSLKNGLLPGLYPRGQTLLAVNADAIRLDPAIPTDWQTQLKNSAAEQSANRVDWDRWALAGALGFALIAAVLWPR
jgi:hypothetical protein